MKYRIGYKMPQRETVWLDGEHSEEEAKGQCEMANYVERGGRTLISAGHNAGASRDSGTCWLYEPITDTKESL